MKKKIEEGYLKKKGKEEEEEKEKGCPYFEIQQ